MPHITDSSGQVLVDQSYNSLYTGTTLSRDHELLEVLEGGNLNRTLTAVTDDPDVAMTFYITGGEDQDRFEIVQVGDDYNLRFVTPPDFDNPIDANQDNIYYVEVTVENANAGSQVPAFDVPLIRVDVVDALGDAILTRVYRRVQSRMSIRMSSLLDGQLN